MNLTGIFTFYCSNLILLLICRNDAGLAAAELALAVERHVLESGSIDTVGTVGKVVPISHVLYMLMTKLKKIN